MFQFDIKFIYLKKEYIKYFILQLIVVALFQYLYLHRMNAMLRFICFLMFTIVVIQGCKVDLDHSATAEIQTNAQYYGTGFSSDNVCEEICEVGEVKKIHYKITDNRDGYDLKEQWAVLLTSHPFYCRE